MKKCVDYLIIKQTVERRDALSLPKIIAIGSIVVFTIIAVLAFVKNGNHDKQEYSCIARPQTTQEINIEPKSIESKDQNSKPQLKDKSASAVSEVVKEESKDVNETAQIEDQLPNDDKIDLLFATDGSKLPLVETITYSSRVPWLSGRPAWIADYASHFETSRHFIARSLNKKTDYFTQKVSPGDRFNVLKKDVSFHILIDLSRTKAWFYGIDQVTNKRYLLKSYNVGVGRKDLKRVSGYLTPIGKFQLGSKVAIYKPGIMGYFQDQQMEMIRVFGTRWMPFEKELGGCSDGARGYGIHGAPWINDPSSGKLVEEREKIGKYESDGCIRLFSEDIEEIFSIVVSKPTVIEVVNNFFDAKLPGEE